MKYRLYDENYIHKGTFESIQQMRNFYVNGSMIITIKHTWMTHLILSSQLSGIGT